MIWACAINLLMFFCMKTPPRVLTQGFWENFQSNFFIEHLWMTVFFISVFVYSI